MMWGARGKAIATAVPSAIVVVCSAASASGRKGWCVVSPTESESKPSASACRAAIAIVESSALVVPPTRIGGGSEGSGIGRWLTRSPRRRGREPRRGCSHPEARGHHHRPMRTGRSGRPARESAHRSRARAHGSPWAWTSPSRAARDTPAHPASPRRGRVARPPSGHRRQSPLEGVADVTPLPGRGPEFPGAGISSRPETSYRPGTGRREKAERTLGSGDACAAWRPQPGDESRLGELPEVVAWWTQFAGIALQPPRPAPTAPDVAPRLGPSTSG